MNQSHALEPRIALPLYRLAHARSGDKGDRLSICLFAYHAKTYPMLRDEVTESAVRGLFSHRGATKVRRYLLPRLDGMNFVLDGVLQGGVNGSLNLDGHGKTLSFRLLELMVQVPADLVNTRAVE